MSATAMRRETASSGTPSEVGLDDPANIDMVDGPFGAHLRGTVDLVI